MAYSEEPEHMTRATKRKRKTSKKRRSQAANIAMKPEIKEMFDQTKLQLMASMGRKMTDGEALKLMLKNTQENMLKNKGRV